MFDYSSLLPRHKHAAFRWLGKQTRIFEVEDCGFETVRSIPGTDGKGQTASRSRWSINRLRLAVQPGWEQHAPHLEPMLKLLDSDHDTNHLLCALMDAHAAVLATGPKVFQPTVEQFDSMTQVDINIPIADYQQPYPALVIKVPDASRRRIVDGFDLGADGDSLGRLVVVRKLETVDGRTAITIMNGEWTYFFQDREQFKTVEDAIHVYCLVEGADPSLQMRGHAASMVCARACLNLCLMLAHYGCRADRPLDPVKYVKHRSRKDLEHLAAADFRAIDMKQTIVVRDPRSVLHDEESVATGREMPPHWRRGHWRNQRWGPGNRDTKLVFIRPCLIRPDRVVGDVADSEVTMVGPR